MKYSKPVIKKVLPVYRLDEKTFRIGAQIGITSEFTDPDHQMWDLIQLMDGSEIGMILQRMRSLHPNLSNEDIKKGLELLDAQGFLDDASDLTIDEPRYNANIAYFSAFPNTTSEAAFKMQMQLRNSNVLLLGLGGGGSNILALLSGLGFARITVVDYDTVAEDNLGRQLLYKESDIGRLKTEAAAETFCKMNSTTRIVPINMKVNSSEDVNGLIPRHDIVICALDEPQFLAQRRVNKAVVKNNIPCVFGASQVTHGRVFSIIPGKTGCFDCLHLYYTEKDPQFVKQFKGFHQAKFKPPTVAYAPAIWEVSAVMVDEVVRILTNYENPRTAGTQFEIDYTKYSSFSQPRWPRYENCPTCGNGNYTDWEVFQYYNDGV